MDSIINRVMKQWPMGTVVTSKMLKTFGVSAQLAARYSATSWLTSVGRGAYVRTGDKVSWTGALHTLQYQTGLPVYVGGETALLLKGLGMFLPLGSGMQVNLFSEKTGRLPRWFIINNWSVKFTLTKSDLFSSSDPSWFIQHTHEGIAIRIAAPERAILEVMDMAVTNDGIKHAIELSDHLTTLRPDILQSLLACCRSVKVKRLFLWVAEHAGHTWFNELNLKLITLGTGKRQIYRGGKLDSKYLITVPAGGDEYA